MNKSNKCSGDPELEQYGKLPYREVCRYGGLVDVQSQDESLDTRRGAIS